MTKTPADLAADLGVDEGDIAVLLDQLDEHAREVTDELAGFLRDVLDPHGERSTTGLYRTGSRRRLRRTYGLGGPDPTAPTGDDMAP